MDNLLWWDKLNEGEKYLFAFLFIDRVGSTKDNEYYSKEKVQSISDEFHKIVEKEITAFNGRRTEWHGDGTVVFFYADEPESLLDRAKILCNEAVNAAFAIYEDLIVYGAKGDEIKPYISVNIGVVSFKKEFGKIKSHELDIGGHVLKVCPEASILIHEEVGELLSSDLKEKFIYFGATEKDNTPVFIFPKSRKVKQGTETDFISQEKDVHKAKKKYYDFIKNIYHEIIPKGLKQERLVCVELFKIYAPLRVRLKEEREIIDYAVTTDSMTTSGTIDNEEFEMDSSATPGYYPDTIRRNTVQHFVVPEVLNRKKNAVILGSPGAGKSTLIKWIALSCVEGRISIKERLDLEENLVPIPVSVGHLSQIWKESGKTIGIFSAIVKYFEIHGIDDFSFLNDEIKKGNVIFLFDGMDEVPSDLDRRDVARWIESFIQAHGENRFVITSRIIGFPGISISDGDIYEIEDLTIDEAKPLIEKWMIAIEKEQRGDNETSHNTGTQEAKKLIDVLENTPQFQTFITNPFLLTLTILIHRIEGNLPNYRIQLFESMIKTLVETWHQARSISIINPESLKMNFSTEAIPVFAPLALWMHENYPFGVVPEIKLKEFISKEIKNKGLYGVSDNEVTKSIDEFLKKIKEGGVLEEKGQELWGFTHLAFEEYLSAKALVIDDLYNKYLKKYRYAPRWEEIFILIASELGIILMNTKKVTSYIENIHAGVNHPIHDDILKKNVLLAGKCIANSANIDVTLTKNVTENLIQFLFGRYSELNDRSAKILGEMSQMHMIVRDRIKYVLKQALDNKNDISASRMVAINTIGKLGIKDNWIIDKLKQEIKVGDEYVRKIVVDTISKLGITDRWVFDELKQPIKDEVFFIRKEAINAIGELKIKDEWAIEELKKAIKIEDKNILKEAIGTIGKLGIKYDWVIEKLKQTINDKDEFVRRKTIDVIGELKIKDDWAIWGLKLAIRSRDQYMRRQAIDAIGKLGIIDVLKEAIMDRSGFVRSGVIDAIGELGMKNKWVISKLRFALNDKDEFVRRKAIDVIGRLKIKDDWVISELRKKLTREKSQYVRRTTIDTIGKLGIIDKWVIEKLKQTIKDNDDFMRIMTIDAIVRLGIKDEWVIVELINIMNNEYLNFHRECVYEALWSLVDWNPD